MELLMKCIFFSALIAATYGRYILPERSILDTPENINCSCDWRYFKHYETKGCVVEAVDTCGCPQKFSCPSNQTQQTPAKVCIYQNKEYKVGSKIITSNVCQVCRCRDGLPPYMSCITKECSHIPDAQGKDCHLIFKQNKCCPLTVECLENESGDTIEILQNETCEYNDQFYPFGAKIYPDDDPCQTCICDENWNGINNSSCYEHDCIFEKHKSKFDAGCIPVYHEKRCCPIEFFCPSNQNTNYSDLSSNESSENYNGSYDNHCIFDGEFFELGKEIFHENPCIKCSCSVPPDFTCVHQTCPPSPNVDNCYPVHNSGKCCPLYDCMAGDAPETLADGCPTPLCADSSCRIETLPGHECPTCVCSESGSEMEHNNLEPVQQISQNFEQMGSVQQLYEPVGNGDEYSEDELQMMPIRIQASGRPILEKIILPEIDSIEYAEGLRELEESSNEDNSSVEAVNGESREVSLSERENSTLLPESELNDTSSESFSYQSEKIVHKRSDTVFPVEQKEFSQEGAQEYNEDIEREGVDSETNGNFHDELESFKKRFFDKNGTIINEILTIDHTVKVPPGCPTPLCEGPWCKIGIPEGHECPTCICKRHDHVNSEP